MIPSPYRLPVRHWPKTMINKNYFQTQFTTSAHTLNQLPDDSVAEVAFAGRSNAGKSSAINAITRNKKLARTSKTPGRTQLINYFEVKDSNYLVDLPGYGYAKVSKSQIKHWKSALAGYLSSRESLRCLVIVMDIRHALSEYDWRLIDWATEGQIAIHCLLTKSDKLGSSAAQQALMKASATLEGEGIECTLQLFSALKKTGIDDAHELLDMYLPDCPQSAAQPATPDDNENP